MRAGLGRRGPDAEGEHYIEVGGCYLLLIGHVLHMRGSITAQPLVNEQGDALLWNGEVFSGLPVGRHVIAFP